MTDGFHCPDCDRWVSVGRRIEVVGGVGESYYECPYCEVTSHATDWESA